MKHLKKVLAMGAALALTLSLAACAPATTGGQTPATPGATPSTAATPSAGASASAAAGVTTVESGKLHMSTNAAFPPYEMVKDDGGFEGIDVDVATKIAEKLGLELVVDDMDFTAAVNAPAQGKSDICMAGLTVSKERQQNLDFTDSYATGIQVVVVKEGSDIATIDDLANDKLIGTQEGTTGYQYCSADPADGGYGEDHVIAYTNGATAIQALIGGKVDCVVIDNMPAQEFVKANPGLKILDTEFANEDYAIAVKKGNTELLSAVNGALKELIADGTVKTIVDTYINAG